MRLGLNNRGETLVTVMISSVLLVAVAAMAAPTILNSLRQQRANLGSPNICRAVAQNVINQIRADGVQDHYYPTRVDSPSTWLNNNRWLTGATSYNPDGVENELTISPALQDARWPSVRAVDYSSLPYESHTPRLIHSSINGLLALYNTSTDICDDGVLITDSNELAPLFQGDSIGNYAVQATLFIRPYDWSTGDPVGCDRPLQIRPYGSHEPPMAEQLGIADFSNYRADRGLEVEIQVTTSPAVAETGGATPTNCVMKEKFEYDRESREPKAPTISEDGGTFTIRNVMTAGTQMVCRSAFTIIPDFLARATGASSGTGAFSPWVPCDQLSVCGSGGTTNVDRATATITKRFGMPANCSATIQAKTFDAHGNVSDTQASNSFGGRTTVPPSFDETSDSPGEGYSVGGVEFSTRTAANRAAAISGLPVEVIEEVTIGNDALMNSVHGNLTSATDNYSSAASANTAAQSSLAAASTAAAAATGATTSAASSRSSASAARSAANDAAASAANARSAANNARAAADAVAAEAGGLGDAIGGNAVAQAEAAAEAAEAEAIAAEEAARRAAALAAAAEAAAAEKEAEEAADDDDDA